MWPHGNETLEQMVARINASAFIPAPTKGERKMPKPVKLAKGKEFTFKATTARGGETKYAWDEWFNGSLLLLERSVGTEDDKGTVTTVTEKKDFEVRTDAMLPKIKTAARKRYKVCQVSRYDADGNRLTDSLIIRARDMTPEERQAEDILRAEEREAKAAKKREEAANTAPQAEPVAAPAA